MQYDVFISYSQAGDSLLAERVQDGLGRFAKPWWRRRALQVFRDQTGLTANPGLWSSIAEALDNSRFFLMLASPEAASSPWCAREVEHWRARHGSEGMLVLLTDGAIVWDEQTSDFDWQTTTALGPALAGCFAETPRYVDMRWARSEVQLDLTDGRFRDQIAELAAPIHGMSKDELAGADVRQHRRTLRQAFAAGIALAMLSVTALALSVYAFNQTAQARAERQRADAIAARLVRTNRVVRTTSKDLVRKNEDLRSALATNLDLNSANADLLSIAKKRNGQLKSANTELNTTNAQLDTTNAQLGTTNDDLNTANENLKTALYHLRSLRVAGVARGLTAGSQAALATHSTDTALLLATEASTFASRSGGVLGDADARPTLVDALQDNPRLVGWLRGVPGVLLSTAISPDGTRAAALSDQGRVEVWSLPDRRLVSVFSLAGGSFFADVETYEIDFLTRDELALVSNGRVDVYRLGDGGIWARLWKRKLSSDTAVQTATSQRGIVVATASHDGLLEYLDVYHASGAHESSAYSRDPIDLIRFDSTGRYFATVGVRSCCGNQPIHVNVFSSRSGALIRRINFVPPGQRAGTGVTDLTIADIRLTANARTIAVLVDDDIQGFQARTYRFDVRSGHALSGGHSDAYWRSVVPYTPIGLSPNLDAVVQRSTDGQTLSVGYIHDHVITGGIAYPTNVVGQDFAHVSSHVSFSGNGQLFLLPGDGGAAALFVLPNKPYSHFARTKSIGSEQDCGSDSFCHVEAALSPDGRLLASITARDFRAATLHITSLDTRKPVGISLRHMPAFGCGARTFFASVPNGSLVFDPTTRYVALANRDQSVDVFDTVRATLWAHLEAPLTSHLDSGSCVVPQLAFGGTPNDRRILEFNAAGDVFGWQLGSEPSSRASIPIASGADGFAAVGSRVVVTTSATAEPTTIAHVFDETSDGWAETETFAVDDPVSPGGLSADGTRLVVAGLDRITCYDVTLRSEMWTTSANPGVPWFGEAGSVFSTSEKGISRRATRDGHVEYTLTWTMPHPPIDPLTLENELQLPASSVFNGSRLISATVDTAHGTTLVTTYPLSASDLRNAACREAGRNLTRAEWLQYVGPVDAYERTCPGLPSGR